MTQIFIDPTKTSIAVQISSQSVHAVGFDITVFAADGNTVIEQFSGNTQAANPFSQALKNNPASYKGTFVSGTFTIISPDGTDSNYTVVFSILLNDAKVSPAITISGATSGGNDIAVGNFQLS